MDKRDHDFLRRLLSTFEVEAREHIHTISSGLIALERTTAADQQLGIIETIFREAHSLKGAARAVNLAEIEALCQALESIFAALKGQEIALSSGKTLDSQLATLAKSAEQDQRALGRMVDDLLEAMKKVSLQPFSSLLEIFPKLARDLARDRGKGILRSTDGF